MSSQTTSLMPPNPNAPESNHKQRWRESRYLDTAQQAIWRAVQGGDLEAIHTFLKISDRRVRLWGLALEAQKSPHDWVVNVEYATLPSQNQSNQQGE